MLIPILAKREARVASVLAELSRLSVTVAVDGKGPRVAEASLAKLAEAAVDAVVAADAQAEADRVAGLKARGEEIRRDIAEGRAHPK